MTYERVPSIFSRCSDKICYFNEGSKSKYLKTVTNGSKISGLTSCARINLIGLRCYLETAFVNRAM